jgi:hypothetical protein
MGSTGLMLATVVLLFSALVAAAWRGTSTYCDDAVSCIYMYIYTIYIQIVALMVRAVIHGKVRVAACVIVWMGIAALHVCGGRGWGNQAGRVGPQDGATASYGAQHL